MNDFKQHLLNESLQRVSNLTKTASSRDILAQQFTVETLENFELQKEASLLKVAMPVAQGQLNLRNSSSNIKWWVVKPEGRVKQIADEINAAFKPFFFDLSDKNKKQTIDPKTYFKNGQFNTSSDQSKLSGEPQCSLRIEFGFTRQLVPTDKQFQQTANLGIETLNKVLPGFKNFVNAIQNSRLTLNPFFHKISPSRAAGTLLGRKQIEEFINSENTRYNRMPLNLPDGTKLAGNNFYADQMANMQAGISLMPTLTDSFDRIYDSNEHLKDIHDIMPLTRAVLEKMRQGYSLNKETLKKEVMYSSHAGIQTEQHQKYSEEKFEKIVAAFNKCLTPLKPNEDPSNFETLWQDRQSQTIFRGFQISGTRTKKQPVGLEVDDIKLMLKNLTIHGPSVKEPYLHPNQFVIPGASMKYQSNGLDSHPTQLGAKMPLLPSLRIVNGKVDYDFDQINLGRVHLAIYGRQIKALLINFGQKCKEWMAALHDPQRRVIAPVFGSNNVAGEMINHIVGSQMSLKRSNAETLVENLARFPTYKQMMTRIQESLSSKNRGTSSIESDNESYMDEECFELLKRYGYYVSKMMDLVSGMMHKSCKEGMRSKITNNRGIPSLVSEEFYGRRYSTPGGKASYGNIVVGIRYAFNSVELGSHDIDLQRIVRDKRHKNKLNRPQSGMPDVVRQTRHHQQGDVIDPQLQPDGESAIVKLVENMQFWIGQSSSDADFKTTLFVTHDWNQLLAHLHKMYPALDSEDGLAQFDPIQINIKKLQNAVSKTIAATLQELNNQSEEGVEVVLSHSDGSQEIIGSPHSYTDTSPPQEIEEVDVNPNQSQTQTQTNKNPVQPTGVNNKIPKTQPLKPPLENVTSPASGTQNPPAMDPKKSPDTKKAKPFPDPGPDYITKFKPKRQLFRKGIDPGTSKLQRAELLNNLVKIADRLDETGNEKLSNKIDLLIQKLTRE